MFGQASPTCKIRASSKLKLRSLDFTHVHVALGLQMKNMNSVDAMQRDVAKSLLDSSRVLPRLFLQLRTVCVVSDPLLSYCSGTDRRTNEADTAHGSAGCTRAQLDNYCQRIYTNGSARQLQYFRCYLSCRGFESENTCKHQRYACHKASTLRLIRGKVKYLEFQIRSSGVHLLSAHA